MPLFIFTQKKLLNAQLSTAIFARKRITDLRPCAALQAVSELQTGNRVNGNHKGQTFICCSAIIGLETTDGQNGRGRGSLSPLALISLPVQLTVCQGVNVREQVPHQRLRDFLSKVPRPGTAGTADRARVTQYG